MKLSFLVLLLIFLPHCSSEQTKEAVITREEEIEVYDINASTNIILALLKEDKLATVLAEDEQDKDKIDTLIKNFSPSEMAFEAEVLSYKNPVVILYYNLADNNADLLKILTELAKKYKDTLKFVKVDKEKLFKITERSEVDIFPTLMVMHERQEMGRLEKPTLSSLETDLQKIIMPH